MVTNSFVRFMRDEHPEIFYVHNGVESIRLPGGPGVNPEDPQLTVDLEEDFLASRKRKTKAGELVHLTISSLNNMRSAIRYVPITLRRRSIR